MTNLNKLAIAIAALSASQATLASVTATEALEDAIIAVGSAYVTFGASSTDYASSLGYLQDLIEEASEHGTYDDTTITATIGDDNEVNYTINVTTHDNSTAMTTARTNLLTQINTDFYGSGNDSAGDITFSNTGGTWDMDAGSVLETWGDSTNGFITELNDLQTAVDVVSDGDYSTGQMTAISTAIDNLDSSITTFESGLDDISEGLDTDDGAGRAATAANWQLGRSDHTLNLSATDYVVQLNGTTDTDQIVNYMINNVAGSSSISVTSSGGDADTYDNLDDYVCELFVSGLDGDESDC